MTETKNTPTDFFSEREAQLKEQKVAFKKLAKLLQKHDALEKEIVSTRDTVLSAGLTKAELIQSLNPSESASRLLKKIVSNSRTRNRNG